MNNKTRRLLLISNSTLHGSGYLDHAETEIRDFLGELKRVLFVPFALFDRDQYAATAQARFQNMGYELTSIHTTANPMQAVKETVRCCVSRMVRRFCVVRLALGYFERIRAG